MNHFTIQIAPALTWTNFGQWLPRMLIIKLKQGGFEQGYEWEDWYEAECEIRAERHYWAIGRV